MCSFSVMGKICPGICEMNVSKRVAPSSSVKKLFTLQNRDNITCLPFNNFVSTLVSFFLSLELCQISVFIQIFSCLASSVMIRPPSKEERQSERSLLMPDESFGFFLFSNNKPPSLHNPSKPLTNTLFRVPNFALAGKMN